VEVRRKQLCKTEIWMDHLEELGGGGELKTISG
jgi:hypothetical protein